MDKQIKRVSFKGKQYRLSGNYYRRNVWGSKGPSNLHRAIWMDAFGEIPEGCEIHHKDHDATNNSLENLEVVSISEHRRLHALEQFRNGTLKPPTARALELAAEWHKSEQGSEWHSQHAKQAWESREWAVKACEDCGKDYRTPYPNRSKYCHANCKQRAQSRRKGASVRLNRRKPIVLSGKRNPSQQ